MYEDFIFESHVEILEQMSEFHSRMNRYKMFERYERLSIFLNWRIIVDIQ